MDDFGSMLSSILSDPESMEKIKGIAESLGAAEIVKEQAPPSQPPPPPPPPGGASLPFGDGMMEKIMPLMMAYSKAEGDRNVQLLKAIKPYISPQRSEIIDHAIMIMKIISVLGGEDKNKLRR